jgi:hypothetical protein
MTSERTGSARTNQRKRPVYYLLDLSAAVIVKKRHENKIQWDPGSADRAQVDPSLNLWQHYYHELTRYCDLRLESKAVAKLGTGDST